MEIDRVSVGESVDGRSDFTQLFYTSVMEGLRKVLGDSAAQAALFYIKLNECLDKPRELHARLESMFRIGSKALEKSIAVELQTRSGVSPQQMDDFANLVDSVRQEYVGHARPRGEAV